MQFFYHPELNQKVFEMLPDEARHCVKSLRKNVGDEIFITDGKGRLAKAQILDASLSHCCVQIVDIQENYGLRSTHFHLAIAPTKNADRIEWLVEKSIEIGIEEISFLRCEHSERTKIDLERLQRLAVSALKQSNTTWIPLMQIIDYKDFIKFNYADADLYMAWCDEHNEDQFANCPLQDKNVILMVGPEGDFSKEEIALARENGFREVKLGGRRLRTETAGLYGAVVYAAAQVK